MNTYINLELKKNGNLVQVWQIWLDSAHGLVLGGCWGRHPFLLLTIKFLICSSFWCLAF